MNLGNMAGNIPTLVPTVQLEENCGYVSEHSADEHCCSISPGTKPRIGSPLPRMFIPFPPFSDTPRVFRHGSEKRAELISTCVSSFLVSCDQLYISPGSKELDVKEETH